MNNAVGDTVATPQTITIDPEMRQRLETFRDTEAKREALRRQVWRERRFLLPILVILLVSGIAASIFQNAPRIVFDRIRPQWSRLSPVSGWNRLFSLQGSIEFGKSLFKFLAIGSMSYMVLRADRHEIINIMFVDHYRNRILYAAKNCLHRFVSCCYHFAYEGEQHQLFFFHMRGELSYTFLE